MADDRFNFPAKEYIQQLAKENRPEINTQPGSSTHDIILVLVALVAQHSYDKLNVLKQSTLDNHSVLTKTGMDKLASNFFIERREGTKSYGILRIYITKKKPITINENVIFYSGAAQWVAVNEQDFSIEDITFDPSRGEWFLDVSVEAVDTGTDYDLSAGDDVSVNGLDVSQAYALYDFVSGLNEDTNAELLDRIEDSIANNELVKPAAIKKILQQEFETIRNMTVIGYGDDGMQRDVISVSLPLEDMFGVNLCGKVNLPLDADGNVAWYDSSGNPMISPIGGKVGAIYDLSGKDFNLLNITWDGVNYTTVSVQPGYVVRLLARGVLNDPDVGDYRVTKVEEVPIVAGGVNVKVIRLDRELKDLLQASYQYKLLGNVGMNSFHVGGKVDVAIDDTSNQELEVLAQGVEEIAPAGSEVIEIPLIDEQVLKSSGDILFEDNIAFVQPVLTVLRVAQVSFGASANEEKVLVPFRDYTIVRAIHRRKYTASDNDVLRIHALESVGGISLNPYIGKRLKITYLANKRLTDIQTFLDDPDNKTSDIKVAPPYYVFMEVMVSFKGANLTQDAAITLIKDFIKSTSFGASISASDITQLLLVAGATYVKQPILLKATRLKTNGVDEPIQSNDIIEIEPYEIFYPVTDMLNITKEDA